MIIQTSLSRFHALVHPYNLDSHLSSPIIIQNLATRVSLTNPSLSLSRQSNILSHMNEVDYIPIIPNNSKNLGFSNLRLTAYFSNLYKQVRLVLIQ